MDNHPCIRKRTYAYKGGKVMNAIYTLKSICGKNTFYVDPFDVNLNPNGATCCDNCRSILICREAWDFLYKGVK